MIEEMLVGYCEEEDSDDDDDDDDLIDLDAGIEELYESFCSKESERSEHCESEERHNQYPTIVEYSLKESVHSAPVPIEQGIQDDKESAGPTIAERTPPPIVILRVESEVSEGDCDKDSDCNEQHKHEEENEIETKVHMAPDTTVNVEQFNIDGAERNETSNDHMTRE